MVIQPGKLWRHVLLLIINGVFIESKACEGFNAN